MSPQQEVQVGAQEHQKIAAQFGFYEDKALQSYVSGIGARVTKKTERPDVKYKFYVLDSPIVNAFALPGGYIYVSRGLLALANSEAELAAVLGHEAGHITGRHSAERYSRGTLASLGAAVVGMAVKTPGVSDAVGLGANLYLSSYSRGQENEADSLGLRYMTRGGYSAGEMPSFLASMQANSALDDRIEGKGGKAAAFNYFSTHPATTERVNKTKGEASAYQKGGAVGQESYFKAINGMVYGDSADQGFVRGRSFIHPGIGFRFDVPSGFTLKNQPSQVVATDRTGAVIIYDMGGVQAATDPMTYLTQLWMKGQKISGAENIKINGMNAATASFPGQVDGRAVNIRLIAIDFGNNKFARFQMAIPTGASASLVEDLKTASYSFQRLSAQEKNSVRPSRLRIVTAKSGDTVASLSRNMPFDTLKEDRFRVLNALGQNEKVIAGRQYKVVVE
jgi:predicted Zn-dependent protease